MVRMVHNTDGQLLMMVNLVMTIDGCMVLNCCLPQYRDFGSVHNLHPDHNCGWTNHIFPQLQ